MTKIGNKVMVIDDDLEGIVDKIEGDTVFFTTNEGFQYHFHKDKLVVIGNDLSVTKVEIKDTPNKFEKNTRSDKTPVYDLHIDKILQRHQHLNAGQKLQIQLEEVHRILNKVRRQHYKEFVLIHGEGRGVLRKEIEKILKQKGYKFSDASYQKYGHGAILVIK